MKEIDLNKGITGVRENLKYVEKALKNIQHIIKSSKRIKNITDAQRRTDKALTEVAEVLTGMFEMHEQQLFLLGKVVVLLTLIKPIMEAQKFTKKQKDEMRSILKQYKVGGK